MKKLLLAIAVGFALLISCEKEEVKPILSDYVIEWQSARVPGYYQWQIKHHNIVKWKTNNVFQDDKFASHTFYSVMTEQFNVPLAQFSAEVLNQDRISIPSREYWEKDDQRVSDDFVGDYKQINVSTYSRISYY